MIIYILIILVIKVKKINKNNYIIYIYMTDEELLNYLFIDKKIYSFNELYKYAKMAHPKITLKIVKN